MKSTEVYQYLQQLTRQESQKLCRLEHPWQGAYINPESRLADPSHGASSRFVFAGGLLILAKHQHPEALELDSDELYHEVLQAAKFVCQSQRASGLIDLHSTNYDSSPDTGFIIQQFAALLELTRDQPFFTELNEVLERFIRRALSGVRDGGFHTPNHRWVICSALSQSKRLFPDLEVQPALDRYLDEGFDIDEDGAYLERSSTIYDTVANNSLLLYALSAEREDKRQQALAAVRQNLLWNQHMHHADGSSETNLSRRQDYGLRHVALNLISSYTLAYFVLAEERFLETADWLWHKRSDNIPESVTWLAYVHLRFGEPQPVASKAPTDVSRLFSYNRVWRHRQGQLSVSAYGGQSHLLNLVYGQAELSALKIAQTYFGVGKFNAETLKEENGSLILHSSGQQKPRLPGYNFPVGRPVALEEWSRLERDHRPIQPAESQLSLHAQENGVHLLYQTLDGLDKVAAQISLDFPVGGIWESEDALFAPAAGQTILHKRGKARMIYNQDVIELSSGHYQQGYLAMRNSEPQKANQVRILLTFLTPIDFRLSLTCYQGVVKDTFPFSKEVKL